MQALVSRLPILVLPCHYHTVLMNLLRNLKSRNVSLPDLLFFKIVLAILGPLNFHVNLKWIILFLREWNGNPLQYYFLENPMDGEAWRATVRGVTKSRTQWRDFTFKMQLQDFRYIYIYKDDRDPNI